MMSLRSIIPAIALGTILISSAQAQTYNTIPMGGGSYSTTGPSGGIYTTMPLGGGWSTTTGPNGYQATTVPFGGGFATTTVTPAYRPSQPQPLLPPIGYR